MNSYTNHMITRMSVLARIWTFTMTNSSTMINVVFYNEFYDAAKAYRKNINTDVVMFLDKMFTSKSSYIDILTDEKTILVRKPFYMMTDIVMKGNFLEVPFYSATFTEVIMTVDVLEAATFLEAYKDHLRLNFEILSEDDMHKFYARYKTPIMTPLMGRIPMVKKAINPDVSMFEKFEILKSTIQKLVAIDSKTKVKDDADTVSFDTFMSTVTAAEIIITKSVIKTYMKARHNYVCDMVMAELNMEAAPTDVNMVRKFNYTGVDCGLTPDFVYTKVDEEQPINYIVDVAVTKAEVTDIAEKKISKYSILAEGLSMHLNQIVTPVALVISVRTMGDVIIPQFMSSATQTIMEVQEKIIKANYIMSKLPGYAEALAEHDKDLDAGVMSERRAILSEMIDCYLALTQLSNKKTYKLEDSFITDTNDFSKGVFTNNEDEMFMKIKTEIANFSEVEFISNMCSEISSNIFHGNVPKMIANLEADHDYMSIIDTEVAKASKTRADFYSTNGNRIPKVFKFPCLFNMHKKFGPDIYESIGNVTEILDDGTRVIRQFFMPDEDVKVVSREGIGFNIVEDKTVIKNMVDFMTAESSQGFRSEMEMRYSNMSKHLSAMIKMRIFEVAWNISKLARNLSYMEGRRFVVKTGKAVFKKFDDDGYSIVILAGSRLTAESQIRFKVITNEEDIQDEVFHSIRDNADSTAETGWLTVSMTDMKTMLMMFEKAVAIASHYLDCWEESRKTKVINLESFFSDEMVILPIVTMMEMKRGTSTTAQYNRYIFNSMMGYMSDRAKMIKDIMAEPVRSRLEAFYRIKQLDWCKELMRVAKATWLEVMTKSMSTASDYDSLMAPSIFSNGKMVEFSFIMNDMYLGNLFQKESGFTGHRSKAIIAKMCKEEMHYLEIRDVSTMNANMTVSDCFEKADEKHVFSKQFIMAMGKRVANKIKRSPKYEEVVMERISRNMHDTMMMTYSLEDCRVDNYTVPVSNEESTNLTFLTMQKLIEEFGTATMSQMVSKDTIIEAIFSMFAKPQIGGPREILIQAYKTRVHVKFLENMMEGFCSIHEKEMLTKGAVKEDIQSSTSAEFKKTLILKAKKEKKFSVISSLIADASRWAPSFVMSMFLYFLASLDLPTEIEEHMATVIRSFSSKTIMLPKSLKKKWERKAADEKEEDEVMEWVRSVSADSAYTMKVFSGMGQGMLHRFSSFLHCAKDDLMDEIIQMHLSTLDAEIEIRTMISSDDLMKQMIITSRDPKLIFRIMRIIMIIYEVTNMLSNIHTNWKKTSLSFIMDEFNSYFSRGKKATMAVIKDVFTCTEVVDLTEPLQAVKDVWSSVSRAFNNGMYLRTAKTIIDVMREWMKTAYCISNEREAELAKTLNCSITELPADIGFITSDHLLGQLIFGPDILMFRSSNSKELNQFYKNIHTGYIQEANEMINTQTLTAISGKIRVRLPDKTDKQLTRLIESYFLEESLVIEEVLDRENRMSMVSDESDLSWTKTLRFTNNYFIGMKKTYGFNTSMQVNSMVRALQAARAKLKTKPVMQEDVYYSFETFVEYIMSRNSHVSSIAMYNPYKEMMIKTEEAELSFSSCTKSYAARHTRRRNLKFRTSELVLRADKSDIIGFLVGLETKLSNRVLTIMSDICDMFGMNVIDFSKSPTAEIMRVFSFSERPALIFSNMMDEYLSMRVNYSTKIMLSEIDKGNALDNLLSVYCERAEPSCVLTIKKQDALVKSKNMITTWMSIGRNLEDLNISDFSDMFDEKDKMMVIETSDSPMDRAVKIWFDVNKVTNITSCKYVFYRNFRKDERRVTHFYTNLHDTVIMHVDKDKKIIVYHILSTDPAGFKDSEIIKFYTLEQIRENIDWYDKYYWDANGLTEVETIFEKKIDYKIETSTGTKDWMMNMRLKWGDTYDSNLKQCVINLFTDKYTLDMRTLREMIPSDDNFMSDFQKVINREMDIKDLETFMTENMMYTPHDVGTREMVSASAVLDNVTSLNDEIMAIKGAWREEDLVAMFAGMSVDKMMDETFGKMVMDEEGEFNWDTIAMGIEDDFLKELMEELEKENDLEPTYTAPLERISMNTYIFDCMKSAFNTEVEMNEKKILSLFNSMFMEEDQARIWDLITTEVRNLYPKITMWMLRFIVALIYLRLARVKDIPKPNKISIINGMEERRNTLILSVDISEEMEILSRLL